MFHKSPVEKSEQTQGITELSSRTARRTPAEHKSLNIEFLDLFVKNKPVNYLVPLLYRVMHE